MTKLVGRIILVLIGFSFALSLFNAVIAMLVQLAGGAFIAVIFLGGLIILYSVLSGGGGGRGVASALLRGAGGVATWLWFYKREKSGGGRVDLPAVRYRRR